MTFRSKYSLAIGGSVALILCILWVVWKATNPRLADEPAIVEFPLHDGIHRLRLIRAEEGLLDYQWKAPKQLSWLPRILRKDHRLYDINLTRRLSAVSHDSRTVSFLFRVVNNRGEWANPSLSLMGFHWIDSHGYEYPQYSHFQSVTSDGGAYVVETSLFPRREKTLTAAVDCSLLYGGVGTAKLDISLPNPFHRNDYPVWKPDPLPITKMNGDMAVQLARFHTYGHSTDATFLHPENDLSDQYQDCVSRYSLEDPTGNHGDALSPFEPVWKINAEVFPSASHSFVPEQVVFRGKLQVPSAGVFSLINKSIERAGYHVTVHGICGGGTATRNPVGSTPVNSCDLKKTHANATTTESSPDPFVVLEIDSLPADVGIITRCQNEARCRTIYRDTRYPSSEKIRTVIVPLGTGNSHADTVSLELIEVKARRFEFFVETQPEWREDYGDNRVKIEIRYPPGHPSHQHEPR